MNSEPDNNKNKRSLISRLFGQRETDSTSGDGKRKLMFDALEPRILYSAAPVDGDAAPEVAESPEPAQEPSASTPEDHSATSAPNEVTEVGAEELQAAPESVLETEVHLLTDLLPDPEEQGVDGGAPQAEGSANDLGNELISAPAEIEVQGTTGMPDLSAEVLEEIATAAEERWHLAGLTEEQSLALANVTYEIGDLAGLSLAQYDGANNIIRIDDDASGMSWFVDSTPMDDVEFISRGPESRLFAAIGEAEDRVDLLSVVLHEQGHALGLADTYLPENFGELMYGGYAEGERRLPVEGQADDAVVGSVAHVAHADVSVSNTADDGSGTDLRAAIAQAVDGDTVTLDQVDTYDLTNGQITIDGNAIGGNRIITIAGQGKGQTFIDAGGLSRVFNITNGANVTFQDLTITGGFLTEGDGAGIYHNGGTLTLTRVAVSGNEVQDTVDNSTNARGGGIYNNSRTIVATDSDLIGNKANRNGGNETAGGGGLFSNGSAARTTWTGGEISGNEARDGAGFYMWSVGGEATFEGVDFNGNIAAINGGAARANVGTTLTITGSGSTNSQIRNNTADNGAGIYNDGATLFVEGGFGGTDLVFDNNDADFDGGALRNRVEGRVTLTDVTITNHDARYGAAIHNEQAGSRIDGTRVTIDSNLARDRAGGVYNAHEGAIMNLTDSIISNNVAEDFYGGGIYNHGTMTLVNTDIEGNYTLDLNGANRRDGHGGGFFNGDGGILNLDANSDVRNNYAWGHGGGGFNQGGTVNADGNTWEGNYTIYNNSDRSGGALWNYLGGIVNLENVTFQANETSRQNGTYAGGDGTLQGSGGAVFNSDQSVLNISGNSTFTNNRAEWGGAITNSSNGSVVNIIGTSTQAVSISGNYARAGGGALNNNSEISEFNLSYVTIQNNISDVGDGGGIRNNNGILRGDHVTIDQNAAGDGNDDDGGGLFLDNRSDVIFTDSVISSNVSWDRGGGVYIEGEPILVRFENTIITGNKTGINKTTASGYSVVQTTHTYSIGDVTTATGSGNGGSEGGGIYGRERTVLELIDSTVSDNIARDDGGGLHINDDSKVLISGSLIQGNLAGYDSAGTVRTVNSHGGGIRVVGRTKLDVHNSAILDNEATQYGGGLMMQNDVQFTMTNSTVAGNVARDHGGGVASWDWNLRSTVENSTFSGNYAGFTRAEGGDTTPDYVQNRNGGGWYNRRGISNLTHTTFSENVANNGAGIRRDAHNVNVVASVVTQNENNAGAARNVGGTQGATALNLVDTYQGNTNATLNALSNAFLVGASNAGSSAATSATAHVQVYIPDAGASNIVDAVTTEVLAADQTGAGRPANGGTTASSDRGAVELNGLATALTLDALNLPALGVSGVEINLDAVANSTGAGDVQFAWTVNDGTSDIFTATNSTAVDPAENETDAVSFTHTIASAETVSETWTVTLTVTDLTTNQTVTQSDTITVFNPLASPMTPAAGTIEVNTLVETGTIETTSDTDGSVSLREAINIANASGAGDFVITFNSALDTSNIVTSLSTTGDENNNAGEDYDLRKTNGAIVFKGNGAANTIIDGGGIGRVFDIQPAVTAFFSGLTITGGVTVDNDHGAGFRADGATVILTNVEIVGNQAIRGSGNQGGGFYATSSGLRGSTVVMTGGKISENIAGDHGGGFLATGNIASTTTVVMDGVEVSANKASFNDDGTADGGGFYFTGQNNVLELKNVSILDNSTKDDGGGFILVGSDHTATFENVTIQRNVVENTAQDTDAATSFDNVAFAAQATNTDRDGGGGMIAGTNNTVNFVGGLIGGPQAGDGKIDFGNYADDDGAGLSIKGAVTVNFDGTTIQGNFSEDDGGGLMLEGAVTVNFDNGTITQNSSINQHGGGVAVRAGTFNSTNSSFTFNHAGDRDYVANPGNHVGGAIYVTGGSKVNLTDASLTNNNAEGRGGAIYGDRSSVITINSSTPGIKTSTISNNTTVETNDDNRGGGAIFITHANTTVNITDATIADNRSPRTGGAIMQQNASIVNLTSVDVLRNESNRRGGAIYLASDQSKLTLQDVTFTGNAVRTEYGGAIYSAGTVTGDSVVFTDNRTNYDLDTAASVSSTGQDRRGGAIYLGGAEASFTGSNVIIADNHSYGRGGGVYVDDGLLHLTNFILRGNSTDSDGNEGRGRGGAISTANRGTIVLVNGEVSGNTSDGHGGAIWGETDGSSLTATNVTFSGNRAGINGNGGGAFVNDRDGGAIYFTNASTVNLNHVTVSDNGATRNGGGIQRGSSTITIENSIVFGNHRDIDNTNRDGDTNGNIVLAGENLLGVRQGGTLSGDTDGRIVVDPDLGALSENGGPATLNALAAAAGIAGMQSHLPASTGGAANAATNSVIAADQRGTTRIAGDDPARDLGAIEVNHLGAGFAPNTATVSEDSSGDTLALADPSVEGDAGDVTIASIDTTGTTGTVTVDAGGDTVTYDPNGQFENLALGDSDTDSFVHISSDAAGNDIGQFQEVGGVVAGDAVNFQSNVAAPGGLGWTDETTGFSGSRTGTFLEHPNGAGIGGVMVEGPFVDYKINITTAGTYRLYIHAAGYDGSSDSIYAGIVELQDGTSGAGDVNQDWYAIQTNSSSTFTWYGSGNPESTSPGSGTPNTFNLAEGTYTLRIQPREDGAALDAWALQEVSLAAPTGTGPAQSLFGTRVEVTVDGANDAPTNNGDSTAELALIPQTDANPSGDTVANLFATNFADVDDGASFAGVAIVGNASTAAEGTWEFNDNVGGGWTAIPTTVDATTNATVVEDTYSLRFVPAAGYSGAPGSLTALPWDGVVTPGTGNAVDITGQTGGTGTFADSASDSVTLSTSVGFIYVDGSNDLVFDRQTNVDDTLVITSDGTNITFTDSSNLLYSAVGSGSGTNTVTVAIADFSGGSLSVNTGAGTDSVTLNGFTSLPGDLSITAETINLDADVTTATGDQTYNGAVTLGGNVQVSGESVTFESSVALGTNALTVSNSSTSTASEIKGAITGSGELTKTGDGTLTIDSAGDGTNAGFTGDVVVDGGVLEAGSSSGSREYLLGTGTKTVTVNNGGELRFTSYNAFGRASSPSPTNTLVINAGGTVTSNNSFTVLNDVTLNGGTLASNGGVSAAYQTFFIEGDVTVGGTTASTITTSGTNGAIHLSAATVFNVADVTGDASADLIVAGNLMDQAGTGAAGEIVKNGAGTMALTSASSYSGTTAVNAGTLQVDGGAISNTDSVAIDAGTLQVINQGNVNVTNGVTNGAGAGQLLIDEGTMTVGDGLALDTLRVGEDAGTDSSLVVSAGAVSVGNGTETLAIGNRDADVTNDATATVDFSSASGVTINVASTLMGRLTGGAGQFKVHGALLLSDSGANTVNTTTMIVGGSPGTGNESNNGTNVADIISEIQFGSGTNDLNVDTLTLGDGKAQGKITITAGGELNISGDTGAATNANLGWNVNGSTGNQAHGVIDASGATLNAAFGTLNLGRHVGGSGAGIGTLIFDAGTVTANTVALATSTGNSSGTITQRGGSFTVANGVTETQTSTLNIENGQFTVTAAGLQVDTLHIAKQDASNAGEPAKNATVTVQGGAVTIGDVVNGGQLEVGTRTGSDTGIPAGVGTLDLTAADSVAINVTQVLIGDMAGGSGGGGTFGTVDLSNVGNNAITASTVRVGNSATHGNDAVTSTLTFGSTINTVDVDTFEVGSEKSLGTVDIAGGGTLNLTGDANTAANLLIGDNDVSTGNNAVGIFDMTGATFKATLDELALGQHQNSSGSGKGTLTYNAGTITANSITLANANDGGTSSNTQNTTGTLNHNGGDLTVGTINLADGASTVNITDGTVTVTTAFNLDSLAAGASSVNLSGGVLDLSGQDVINRAGAETFTVSGTGLLKDVNDFGVTYNQTGGTLQIGADGAIDTMTVDGDFNVTGGAIEIALDGNGVNDSITVEDGTAADQAVDISNSNLLLTLNYAAASGNSHVLIANDGTADAVTGSFSNYPEVGATGLSEAFDLTFGTDVYTFQINYAGGDGNDVVLNSFGSAETSVEKVGNNLVITDINNDSDDALTITDDGTHYVIQDANLALTTSSGFERVDGNTIRVDKTAVEGLIVNAGENETAAGDTVTFGTALTFDGPVTVNAEAINLNGGAVNTGTANQDYNGAVILGADTTLTGNDVTFQRTVDSDGTPRSLATSLGAAGTLTFKDHVGNTSELLSLDTGSTGTTHVIGNTVLDNLQTGGGIIFNFDASFDPNTADNLVPDLGSAVGGSATVNGQPFNLLIDDSVVTFASNPSAGFAGITGAYVLPGATGSSADNQRGLAGLELQTGGNDEAPQDVNHTLLGVPDVDVSDVTFEFWLKPDDLTGKEVIWETGGGTGTGFGLDGSNLIFQVIQGSAPNKGTVVYDLDLDPSGIFGGDGVTPGSGYDPASDDFIQVIGTLDVSTKTVELFVNGTSVGSDVKDGALSDWDGGDPSGLGTVGGANMGGFGGGAQGYRPFDGQIAAFRLYSGVLTSGPSGQIQNNFNAVQAGGQTEIQIKTTQTQTFGNDLSLGIATVVESSGGGALGNVTFGTGKTIDADPAAAAPGSLTVNTAGVTDFNGIIGGSTPLGGLATDSAGTTTIDTTAVTSSGAIVLGDNVTTSANVAIDGASVSFVGTSTFNADATVTATSADATFTGEATFNATGTVTALGDATFNAAANFLGGLADINAGGNADFNDTLTFGADAAIDAGSNATFDGVVTLGGTTTVTATNIIVAAAATIDSDVGNLRDLTLNASGTTDLDSIIGGLEALGSLTTDAAGITQLGANVIVAGSGGITFGDRVTLTTDVDLESNHASGDVTFGSTVDGAFALTVNTPGSASTLFRGDVGSGVALTSLTTDGNGFAQLGGPAPIAGGTLLLNFDADEETLATSGLFEGTSGATVDERFNMSGAGISFGPVNDSSVTGILNAYTLDGTSGGVGGNFHNLTGNPTDADASLEFWIRPTSNTATGMIFEAGGSGDGSSVVYDGVNQQVIWTADDGNVQGQVSAALPIDGEFHQVFLTYDRDNSNRDILRIYIDGVFVDDNITATTTDDVSNDTDTNLIDDWAGSDGAGLGAVNGATAEGSLATTPFIGDIAKFRIYTNSVGAAGVLANYEEVANHNVQVTTTGDQLFGGAVQLQTEAVLTGNNITFNGKLDSSDADHDRDLTVNTTGGGVTLFAGNVGDDFELGNLTTNFDGHTVISANITANGADGGEIRFDDAVLLGTDSIITQNGDATSRVLFANTLDAVDGVAANLTVNTPNDAVTQFAADVGSDALDLLSNDTGLASITTDSAGTTLFLGLSEVVNGVDFLADATQDPTGNDFAGIGDSTTWRFTTTGAVDTQAPSLESLSPADDGVDVATNANLALTFDEDVQAGTGNITIHLAADDSVVDTIDVTGGLVTVAGRTVKIDPSLNLAASTAFYVNVAAGAIRDTAGNDFAGILDTTTWSFTTGTGDDVTAPTVDTLNPADDAGSVAPDSNLELAFDEAVQKGAAGTITIHLASDDSVVQTIDVNDAAVSVNGATVTVDPPTGLAAGTEFYVNIGTGAIRDIAGNDFAGIVDTTSWSFTTATADRTAPLAVSLTPANDADGVAVGANLEMTFDEAVQKGAGTITIHLASDDSVVETIDVSDAIVTISGATVTIDPASDLTAGTEYYVNVSSGAFQDFDRWDDQTGISGLDFQVVGNVTRVEGPGVSSLPGITAAYDFPGGATENEAGALLSISGSTTEASFTNAPGDWTDEDVSIEIWFKPDNLTPSTPEGQILFEDGGGTGFGFFIDNNELRLRKAPNGGNIAYNLDTDSLGLLTAPATSEFIQAIGTFNTSTDQLELFINGVSVGTDIAAGGDWSGSDPAGVGTRGGANTGGIGNGQSNTESFDGQVGLFRVYNGQALEESQVRANYAAVAGAGNLVVSVTTSGDQTYNDAVSVDSITTLNALNVNTTNTVTMNQDLTVNVAGATGQATGDITGGANLIKDGNGTFTLASTTGNTYTGETTIREGRLVAAHNDALGTTDAGNVTIESGGTLGLIGGITIPAHETISLLFDGTGDATIENLSGDNFVEGLIDVQLGVQGDLRLLSSTVDDTLTVNGNVNLQQAGILAAGDGDTVVNGNIASTVAEYADLGEVGQVLNVGGTAQTVNFAGTYVNPVIVALAEQGSGTGGADPNVVEVRIFNVDAGAGTFQIQLDVPPGANNTNPPAEETVNFLVVEAGTYTLDDGTVIQAGTVSVSGSTDESVSFGAGVFATTPVAMTQLMSQNDASFVKPRHRAGVNANGFSFFLEQAEGQAQHSVNETVGYIAISPTAAAGATTGAGLLFEAGTTPNAVTHSNFGVTLQNAYSAPPIFIGDQQTIDGVDPSGLRFRYNGNGVNVFTDEDRSGDTETSHADEVVGFVAFANTGLLQSTNVRDNQLVMNGAGTLTLNGTNELQDGVEVNDGVVLVNGTTTAETTVIGGSLGGTGTIVGEVISTTGEVAPGEPDVASGVGTLTVGDDNDVNLSGDFEFQINGDTSADLLSVTGTTGDGTVTVGGTLTLTEISDAVGVAGGVTPGSTVTLISNDGTDVVIGTFAGLPEGATVMDDDGDSYIISYAGGDGNDVVLFAGQAETNVALVGNALSITDSTNDSTDTLSISYDAATNTYTIQETANTALVLNTTGLTNAQVTRPNAQTVVIDANQITGGITSLTIDTTGPDTTTPGVENDDTVTVSTSNGSLGLSGDITITADDVVFAANAQIDQSAGSGGVIVNADRAIAMNAGSGITTNDGAVTLTATGNGDGGFVGIELSDADITTTSGNIVLTGEGADSGTGSFRHGVLLAGGSTVTSTDGNVTLAGLGSGDTDDNDHHGVVLADAGTRVASTNGTVTLDGTGGYGQNDNANESRGVVIGADTVVETVTGEIDIDGEGGLQRSNTDENTGVQISGTVQATGTGGAVDIYGSAGTSHLNNYGIHLNSSGSVTSVDGAIVMEGQGGGGARANTNSNHGIFVEGAVNSSGSATITLTGFGGGSRNDGDGNIGVMVSGTAAAISSSGGLITINGVAGGHPNDGSTNNDGVRIQAGGSVVGTNSARITIDGTGGSDADGEGVQITGADSVVSVVDGDISITGSGEDGVELSTGTTAAVVASGIGNISISGHANTPDLAGGNVGTEINSIVTSGSGNVTIASDDHITFGADSDVNSTGGTVKIEASTGGAGDIVMADGALIDAGGGNVDVDAVGDITLGGLVTTAAVTIDSASGSILDGGDTDKEVVAASAVLNAALNVGTVADPLETQVATLAGSSGTDFYVANMGALDIGAAGINAGNDLQIVNNDNITDSGTTTVGGAAQFTTTVNDADINVNQLAVTGLIGLSTTGADSDATIVNATAIDFKATNVGGNLAATATTGGIGQSAGLDVDGTTALAVGTDNIDLSNVGNDFTGAVSIVSAQDVTLVDANGIDLGASTISGNLDVTSSTGDITDSGTVSISGTVDLTTSNGNIITNQLDVSGSIALNASGTATIVNTTGIVFRDSTTGGDLTATSTTGDLNIGTGVTLTSTGGGIFLSADGTLLFDAAANLNAAGNVEISLDQGVSDGTGVIVQFFGQVDAAAAIISGGEDPDLFRVQPSAITEITVRGGDPKTLPGDALLLLEDMSLASSGIDGTGASFGTYTATGFAPVHFNSIESDDLVPSLAGTNGALLTHGVGQGPIAVFPDLIIRDAILVTEAVVQFAGRYIPGEDQLTSLGLGSNMTQTWDRASGTLLISAGPGGVSVTAMERALRSVVYINKNGSNPTPGARSISVVLQDGVDQSNSLVNTVIQKGVETDAQNDPAATAGTQASTLPDGGTGAGVDGELAQILEVLSRYGDDGVFAGFQIDAADGASGYQFLNGQLIGPDGQAIRLNLSNQEAGDASVLPTLPPMFSLTPFFAGTSGYGSQIVVTISDGAGGFSHTMSVTADAAGNWTIAMPGIELGDRAYSITITEVPEISGIFSQDNAIFRVGTFRGGILPGLTDEEGLNLGDIYGMIIDATSPEEGMAQLNAPTM